jgi:hypothetical protein
MKRNNSEERRDGKKLGMREKKHYRKFNKRANKGRNSIFQNILFFQTFHSFSLLGGFASSAFHVPGQTAYQAFLYTILYCETNFRTMQE